MRRYQRSALQPDGPLGEWGRLALVTSSALQLPGYLDLKALAVYSSCSVRWLRDRLVDRTYPLPHYRVGGKVLVRKEGFDVWMVEFRIDRPTDELDDVVSGVLAQLQS